MNEQSESRLKMLALALFTTFALHIDVAASEGLNNNARAWQDAHYEARNYFFIKRYFSISSGVADSRQVDQLPIAPVNSPIEQLFTYADYDGRHITTRDFFHPEYHGVYSNLQILGKSPRFFESYVKGDTRTLKQRRPLQNEKDYTDQNQWSDIETQKFSVSFSQDCNVGPMGFLRTIIHDVATKPGDQFTFCYFNSQLFEDEENNTHMINVIATEFVPMEMEYRVIHHGRTTKETHTITALELHVVPTDSNIFNFLGLEDDITLYLDIKRQLILKISGNAPLYGKINYTLTNIKK